jgi:hypothetical protein
METVASASIASLSHWPLGEPNPTQPSAKDTLISTTVMRKSPLNLPSWVIKFLDRALTSDHQ